jgi:hypothetical protein
MNVPDVRLFDVDAAIREAIELAAKRTLEERCRDEEIRRRLLFDAAEYALSVDNPGLRATALRLLTEPERSAA